MSAENPESYTKYLYKGIHKLNTVAGFRVKINLMYFYILSTDNLKTNFLNNDTIHNSTKNIKYLRINLQRMSKWKPHGVTSRKILNLNKEI